MNLTIETFMFTGKIDRQEQRSEYTDYSGFFKDGAIAETWLSESWSEETESKASRPTVMHDM